MVLWYICIYIYIVATYLYTYISISVCTLSHLNCYPVISIDEVMSLKKFKGIL